MANQENEKTIRAFYEAFNDKNVDKAKSALSDKLEWWNIPFDETLKSKQEFESYFKNWGKAFPDGSIHIKEIVLSGDTAVVEYIGTGAFQGPMQGKRLRLDPTGKRFELRFCDILTLDADGKISGARMYFDSATMFRQLGVEQRRVAA